MPVEVEERGSPGWWMKRLFYQLGPAPAPAAVEAAQLLRRVPAVVGSSGLMTRMGSATLEIATGSAARTPGAATRLPR